MLQPFRNQEQLLPMKPFFIKKAASSALPFLTGFCFFEEVFELSSVAPQPPKITLKNDLFIPLHIIYESIAPEDPTNAPVIINALVFQCKPIPAAASQSKNST